MSQETLSGLPQKNQLTIKEWGISGERQARGYSRVREGIWAIGASGLTPVSNSITYIIVIGLGKVVNLSGEGHNGFYLRYN